MMRLRAALPIAFAAATVIATAPTAVRAQDGPPIDEYAFSGGAIGCSVSKDAVEGLDPASDEYWEVFTRRCLRMGDIYIHMTRAEAEALLPPINQEIPDGDILYVTYPHFENDQLAGYYTLGYRDDVVIMIQATGAVVEPDSHFSSVRLFAPKETIIMRFGPPHAVIPVPDIEGEFWGYGEHEFSFEIVNGLVYSIRLNAPELD